MSTAVNEVVRSALKKFAHEPQIAAKQLRALVESCQQDLAHAILPVLNEPETGPGLRYLLALLAGRGMLLGRLSDPREFSLPEAVRISQEIGKLDTNFEARLTAAAASPGAAPGAVERAMLIVDPRRRADFVEALWQAPAADTRAVFERFTQDPNHRVRANALLGLYRCGDPASVAGLYEMCRSEELNWRAAAAWTVQTIRDVRFAGLVKELADEPGRVGRNAKRALETLERAEAAMRALPAPKLRLNSFRPGAKETQVEVTVTGAGGAPAGGPPLTSFIIIENGEPLPVYSGEALAQDEGGPAYRLKFAVETGPDEQPLLPIRLQLASHTHGWAEAEVYTPGQNAQPAAEASQSPQPAPPAPQPAPPPAG